MRATLKQALAKRNVFLFYLINIYLPTMDFKHRHTTQIKTINPTVIAHIDAFQVFNYVNCDVYVVLNEIIIQFIISLEYYIIKIKQ